MRPGGARSDRRRGRLEPVRFNEAHPSFRHKGRRTNPCLEAPMAKQSGEKYRPRFAAPCYVAGPAAQCPSAVGRLRRAEEKRPLLRSPVSAPKLRLPGERRRRRGWRNGMLVRGAAGSMMVLLGRVCGARRRRTARRRVGAIPANPGRDTSSGGARLAGFKRFPPAVPRLSRSSPRCRRIISPRRHIFSANGQASARS